ncbi:MAG TPA: SPOR domain-containing protein [Gammaproteobacteria bacterium]|jgi:cell division protein FtsN
MASTKRRQREQLPGWAWMLFGLSIGLGFALFVYLESNDLRISESLRELTTEIRPGAVDETADSDGQQQPDGSPEEVAADEAARDDEPGLSFYTRLREAEVIVPGTAPADNAPVPATQTAELQAGSFPSMQGADTRQATLALLGITSRIESAVVGDILRFRVIVGPLTGRDEINRVARRLDQEQIEYFRRPAPSSD